MNVLKRNEVQIQKEFDKESSHKARFQPYVTEFLKNDFDYKGKPKIEVMRELIYSGGLIDFLQKQALLKSPEIERMPINQEMKLKMADYNSIFPNSAELETLYNAIRQLTPQVKAKVYGFDLDDDGSLLLSKAIIQKIVDDNTVYGNEKQFNTFEKVNKVLADIKAIKTETGINIFAPGIITGATYANLEYCEVNAIGILMHKN
jgi:hypothetical protein